MIQYNHIILAREARGLSQKELAELLDLSPGKLSKVENGLQDLPEDKLALLSEKLDFPSNFFTDKAPFYSLNNFYYRKLARTSKSATKQFEATINIVQMHFDKLLLSVDLPDLNLPDYSKKDNPEQLAQALRRYWRVPNGPIENLTQLLEKNGIVVFYFDFSVEDADGLSFFRSDGIPVAIINNAIPSDRKRLTLAHELGHLLMHFRIGTINTKEAEEEAWRFAVEFMMPESEVKQQLFNVTLPSLARLKRIWKVSMVALLRRAFRLNLIDQNKYRYTYYQYTLQGYRKEEPIEFPSEKGRIVSDIVQLHKEHLGYTDEELAGLLRMSLKDYYDFYSPDSNRHSKIFKLSY